MLLTGKVSILEQASSAKLLCCPFLDIISLLFQRWVVRKWIPQKSQNFLTLFLRLANVVICGFLICGPKFWTSYDFAISGTDTPNYGLQ